MINKLKNLSIYVIYFAIHLCTEAQCMDEGKEGKEPDQRPSVFLQDTLLVSDELSEKKAYHLNEEQTIARFYPPKTNWRKKLNSIENFHSNYFISEGLCFRGGVNVERFLDAMHNALQDFDFFFCQLCRIGKDLYAICSPEEDDNKPFIQLEIEKQEETINNSTLASIIPNKIDERIRGVVTDQFEGLPMGAFRLTIFIDGFTVGCYWNHAFFDQSSMVYFFKYLSHIYSYGRDNISLKKPCLVDTDLLSLSAEPPQVFKNISDFREYGEAFMGYKYNHREDDAKPLPQLDPYITVDLNFNISEINKLKCTESQYLSVNDIIHATLLKIYSFNPNLPLDSVFCFGFVCNMRKYCGLGEEAIGNILSHPLMSLKLEDIKTKTILELALSNRKRVSEITLEYFKEVLSWYRHHQEYGENPLHYVPTFNLLNVRVTNWSTFNYDSILFDGVAPIELKAPCLAPLMVNVISFDNKESEILKSSIYVPFNALGPLRELEHNTKLFGFLPR